MEQLLKIIIYKKSLPVFVICGVDVSGGNKVAFDTLKEKKINSYFYYHSFLGVNINKTLSNLPRH